MVPSVCDKALALAHINSRFTLGLCVLHELVFASRFFRFVTRRRRGHCLQWQGHHRQAVVPLRGGCRHGGDAAHVDRAAVFHWPRAVVGTSSACQGQSAHTSRCVGHHGPRLCGLLPVELFGFLGAAIHHGQLRAAHSLSQPHDGGGVGMVVFQEAHSTHSHVGHGVELQRRAAGVLA